jgi:hypothetical protein
VTSNDGLYTLTPSGASRTLLVDNDDDDDDGAATSVTSDGVRSSITISRPLAISRSIVDVGTHAYTGTPCSRATIDYIHQITQLPCLISRRREVDGGETIQD